MTYQLCDTGGTAGFRLWASYCAVLQVLSNAIGMQVLQHPLDIVGSSRYDQSLKRINAVDKIIKHLLLFSNMFLKKYYIIDFSISHQNSELCLDETSFFSTAPDPADLPDLPETV